MRVFHTLGEINFEWDSYKAVSNFDKHEVSFAQACEVFFDPFLHYDGEEFVDDELRENVIGMTANWQLLSVAYTLRDEVIRLISARPATNAERRRYEDQ